MSTNNQLAFCDTETTGLDPDVHQIWEVGLIVDDNEYRWFLPVDLGRADPIALKIGGYYERHPNAYRSDVDREDLVHANQFAEDFAGLTRGRHLVGAVISFDEERLRRLLKRNGACPEWSHRIICVETLVSGKLGLPVPIGLAKSADRLGLTVEANTEHTALGDARLAKAVYEAVMSVSVVAAPNCPATRD